MKTGHATIYNFRSVDVYFSFDLTIGEATRCFCFENLPSCRALDGG